MPPPPHIGLSPDDGVSPQMMVRKGVKSEEKYDLKGLTQLSIRFELR